MAVRTNLVVDVVIAAAFLVAANPPVAGLAVHEWFGLAFGAAIVVHLVLHWEWIVRATGKLLGAKGTGLRLNYLVDAFLLVALTATVLSGLLGSRHVLPWLGLPAEPARGWRGIHSFAANSSLAAMGVHLGLHWNWIALNLPRLVGRSQKKAGRARSEARPSAARTPFAADAGQ
jgi:hypothetical protein